MRIFEVKEAEPTISVQLTTPLPQYYVVGVDLGNLNDSTAITVVEVYRSWEVTYSQTRFEPLPGETGRKPQLTYLVRLLHRPRIGIGYPEIISQVQAIMQDLPEMPEAPVLIMDATGLGAPVVQRARELGMKPIGLTITGGNAASLRGRDWSAPKGLIVGGLRLVMHQRLLKVAQGFAARETLQNELAAFTARLSPSGRASFEAAGSEHDDTVLSLAMAILAAKNRPKGLQFIDASGFWQR